MLLQAADSHTHKFRLWKDEPIFVNTRELTTTSACMTLRMTAETDAPNQDLTYDQNPVLLLIPSNTIGQGDDLYVPEVPDPGGYPQGLV